MPSIVFRNWNKWKQWRLQREAQQQRQVNHDDAGFENLENEMEDVPDGQLCVICLMRRRRSVFIPCGHLVCCQGCAVSVEQNVAPKCPVCRQEIRNSVRIFESWIDGSYYLVNCIKSGFPAKTHLSWFWLTEVLHFLFYLDDIGYGWIIPGLIGPVNSS